MNLNEKIVKLRKELNMTLQELADKVGVNVSTVQRWEKNDIKNMRRDKIRLLADALETTPDYLMGWSEPPKKGATLKFSPELVPVEIPTFFKKRLPLIGNIAAGTPIEAIQEVDEYIDIESEVDCDCCLRVCGNSMIEAGIHNGDIALIKYQETLQNGQIGAIILDNEVTLKKFYKYDNTLILRPCNEEYQDMVFTEENHPDSIRVYGKCVGVVHKI